jgi:hypothetical protein
MSVLSVFALLKLNREQSRRVHAPRALESWPPRALALERRLSLPPLLRVRLCGSQQLQRVPSTMGVHAGGLTTTRIVAGGHQSDAGGRCSAPRRARGRARA